MAIYRGCFVCLVLITTAEAFIALFGPKSPHPRSDKCTSESISQEQQRRGRRCWKVNKFHFLSKVESEYDGDAAGYPLQPSYPEDPIDARTCWIRYFYEGILSVSYRNRRLSHCNQAASSHEMADASASAWTSDAITPSARRPPCPSWPFTASTSRALSPECTTRPSADGWI